MYMFAVSIRSRGSRYVNKSV